MIHEVVEVGMPTAKSVSPLSSKRHPAKTLATSVTLNKLRVNLYQGAYALQYLLESFAFKNCKII